MPNEDLSRRIEDIESKIAELEDLELTNKIDLLEIKTLVKSIQASPGAAAPGAPIAQPQYASAPKDIVKALDNLYKTQNAAQRRLDTIAADVQNLRTLERRMATIENDVASMRGKKQMFKPMPAPEPYRAPVPQPVIGELQITDIRSKIEEARRIMGK